MPTERFRHIMLEGPSNQEEFTSIPKRGSRQRIPNRNRASHSAYIRRKLDQALKESDQDFAAMHVERNGVYLEFISDPNADLVTKSLEDLSSKKIRLLNVRTIIKPFLNEATGEIEDQDITYATVYVAHEKKGHFFEKLRQYAEEETPKGAPRNAALINSIGDIRKALLVESFWQDPGISPPDDDPDWCEVWLSSDSDDVIGTFEALLQQFQIQAKEGVVKFPERAVKVVLANNSQLALLTTYSDDIAEYRRAKVTAAFWTEMENRDQAEWVEDLLARTRVDEDSDVAVCILDTGVNNGHPLIAPVLGDKDCLTCDTAWGTHDHDCHGTLMAGLAAYGDLQTCLENGDRVTLRHRLESVKILPQPPEQNEPNLWGYVTAQGISRAEIHSPDTKRILAMPVTVDDSRDRGRPSSWSGAVDQLASGADDDIKRLLIVSAGNLTDVPNRESYPNAQITDSVHDPAQAWNALTVGAYTDLTDIHDASLDGYEPLASQGELSPFSTSSSVWEDKWPIKPEIVMEGGNAVYDGSGPALTCEDLSLLSTWWKPSESHFHPFHATSAATAQAAWFAAQLQYEYPNIWPETIRALMVHSASWTDALKRQFLSDDSKTSHAQMLRICGYGVPDLEQALYSARNSLTLISQAELQPFDKKPNKKGGGYQTKDMHLYDLPWPKAVLLELPPETEVQMRITLSYFIEPGPGEIGWRDRYRYSSHVLRFDLNSPGESQDEFMKRINKAARDEDEEKPETESPRDHWRIGSNARHKGSLHSDIWKGTAADLAGSNLLAVYPAMGWWRLRPHLHKVTRKTRYALIVTITTPEEAVDIYTPVATELGITVPVEIEA